MDAAGITDNETRAGIAAIAMGESQMRGYTERGYSMTSNARIRQVFGLRVAGMSDAELNALKASDRRFFNHVYGSQFAIGRQLGNLHPDDGYRFRGRGFIQLTGRANYARYAAKIGRPEIIEDPDLANDPAISAALTVAYIKDRYHGGGWDALLACVGNNTPDIKATKTAYFRRFMASGEYAAR
jgi:predicted chitinase